MKTDVLNFFERKNDEKIYELISEWIISSLSDSNKRQLIGEELLKLPIKEEYKKVPNNILYRVGNSNKKFVSYTYDYKGIKKMIKWYKIIFNKNVEDEDIITENVDNLNILICIPTFLKLTRFSSGKKFDAIWKSEYEVISINKFYY